jgi:imidazoleglycerol-phosphate dehydratase/histidinol-phosphatase
MPEEGSPNRKPGTGMLQTYMDGSYDLGSSYVIGDRLTDVQLAANLGTKAILYGSDSRAQMVEKEGFKEQIALVSEDWDEIYHFLRASLRRSLKTRHTSETDITVDLALDGRGRTEISTGLGFFDHMLDQLGRHGDMDLAVHVSGDLHVDEHHTIEDTAIVLGEAFLEALGDKRGINRYAFVLPMDDALATLSLDLGGRSWLEWDVDFSREMIGDVPTEMFFHFFKSFCDGAKCNLNIKAEGHNSHHKIEAVFKAFARALKEGAKLDPDSDLLPSTKGTL